MEGSPTSAVHVATMFDEQVDNLALDPSGALVMSGASSGAYTLRIFVDGAPVWTWATDQVRGNAHTHTALADNAVIIAATESDAVELRAGALEPHGETDLVLVKVLR